MTLSYIFVLFTTPLPSAIGMMYRASVYLLDPEIFHGYEIDEQHNDGYTRQL